MITLNDFLARNLYVYFLQLYIGSHGFNDGACVENMTYL